MSTHDQRPSPAWNLFYTNRSVASSMRGKWTTYNTVVAYLYGEPRQVLYTGLGYADMIKLYGSFAYNLYVPLDVINQPSFSTNTWNSVVDWLAIQKEDLIATARPGPGDVLILVGSNNSQIPRITRLILKFKQAGASVLNIVPRTSRIPGEILKIPGVTGAYSDVFNGFMVDVVDNTVQRRCQNKIYLAGGDEVSFIATAMGAFDHLLRRPGIGKEQWRNHTARVIVDNQAPILTERVAGYADVLRQFNVPVLQPGQVPLIQIPRVDNELQIAPVQAY